MAEHDEVFQELLPELERLVEIAAKRISASTLKHERAEVGDASDATAPQR